jgi:hypothetical protein
MTSYTTKLLKTALSALHYTGFDALVAPYTRGAGIVFMLHHVTPEPPGAFDPNRILRVTPTFLDSVIGQVQAAGFDVVSLDDAHDRLTMVSRDGCPAKPFACFTFDDGYKDNLIHAYPVFKRRNLPFTVYVPTIPLVTATYGGWRWSASSAKRPPWLYRWKDGCGHSSATPQLKKIKPSTTFTGGCARFRKTARVRLCRIWSAASVSNRARCVPI